jgi:hypothetical protein
MTSPTVAVALNRRTYQAIDCRTAVNGTASRESVARAGDTPVGADGAVAIVLHTSGKLTLFRRASRVAAAKLTARFASFL